MALKYDCIKNDQLNRTAFINAKHNANSFCFSFSCTDFNTKMCPFVYIFFSLSHSQSILVGLERQSFMFYSAITLPFFHVFS